MVIPNEKVIYIEGKINFPFVYTNSRMVCNYLNGLGIFFDGFYGRLKPCKENICDLDGANIQWEYFSKGFDYLVGDFLRTVECRVIYTGIKEEGRSYEILVHPQHRFEVE